MAEGMNPFRPSRPGGTRKSAEQNGSRRPHFWRLLILLLLIGAGGYWIASAIHQRQTSQALLRNQEEAARSAAQAAAQRRLLYADKKIPPRTTFSEFMEKQGLTSQAVQEMVQQTRPVYNLGRVRAGNDVTLVNSASGQFHAIRYQIDENQVLWVTRNEDRFDASIKKIPYVTKVAGVAGTVYDSLFQAIESQGEGDELAVKIADIFGWDLDFNTDTRQGDRFAILVEKKSVNGHFVNYGRVLAAEYTNGNHRYQAVLFHDRSGRPAFYGPSGKSMKKAFLRSPLSFAARITSHFSYHRFHPILRRYRPHLGIDYAAPIGSRVQAVADGTVIFAGWDGGAGKLVKLRHSHGYETLYMHLSRILVHRGQRVHQGQIIALTGETGLATGPHLHFGIEQDGHFRNFLALNLPPAQSVSRKEWSQFVQVKTKMLGELATLESLPHGAEQASLQGSQHRSSARGE
jgi:murein DD-endopeptidase MepM/ murein hydrolase activator NlpD